MDVGVLTALLTEGAGQFRAAIQAVVLAGMAARTLAGLGFDRTSDHAAGDRVANRLDIAHQSPLAETLGGAGRAC